MTTPEAKPESKKRLARILSGVGAIWIALFIVSNVVNAGGTPIGDVLAFFGDNLFFPIALLFSGRVVRRQTERDTGKAPESSSRRTPPIVSPGASQPRPQRSAPQARPVPKPEAPKQRTPSPSVTPAAPDIDELAKAVGFDELDETITQPDRGSSYTPKSSEEMIAEARKKLARDPESRD